MFVNTLLYQIQDVRPLEFHLAPHPGNSSRNPTALPRITKMEF